jgi:hypothetical protein
MCAKTPYGVCERTKPARRLTVWGCKCGLTTEYSTGMMVAWDGYSDEDPKSVVDILCHNKVFIKMGRRCSMDIRPAIRHQRNTTLSRARLCKEKGLVILLIKIRLTYHPANSATRMEARSH